ncbi:hypothetical protein [Clostridium chromiireducens]|uniref:Transmembrane protein n=1 Tax=Clostridium chromiireducens TaxID=225345 RepID=A0A1V4I6V7_9CLOT|nr:hypothetical protein [Clostridium chromiireducens]OPJ55728.1 hypothetical protein CLCHR_46280 [Clostridium chromiireducens]
MKIKICPTSYNILFIISAILITIGILFTKPQVGVADQGDFDRVMSISGLTLLDSDSSNPNFSRFYKYIITDYKIIPLDDLSDTITGCSLSYLIVLINCISKLMGVTIFKTHYLATVYSIIYILSFSIILKSLNIKNSFKFLLIALLILFVFFDGNYLIWFNSLYGEPMMLTTLLLFISSVLNYINYKYVMRKTEHITLKVVYILISSFLFLGSKLQVLTALPFVVCFLIKIVWDNKYYLNKINKAFLCIFIYLVIVYPIGVSTNCSNLCKDTEYNSVFYGILNDSKTPEQDLIDLGLNPDMAVDAGKHAYLDVDEYVKYIPRDEATYSEFYDKISNLKLAEFYLRHPNRLFSGMKYTVSKAFYTSTSLGKYSQSDNQASTSEFHKFTLWSYIRENFFPRSLLFIILIYLSVILFSFYKYIKNKYNLETKNKIFLLWTIILISIAQFPMPFIGNGRADTAKQLFLFNSIFDGLIFLICIYIFFKIIDTVKFRLQK